MDQQSTEFGDLLFEVRNGIGRATFNRPQARNAFTFEMYERLAQICEQADKDRSIKVLVLQGAGDKAFASGTDINQFRAFQTPEHAIEYWRRSNNAACPPSPRLLARAPVAERALLPAAICAWVRKRQDLDFLLPARLGIAFRCRASADSPR